MATYDTRRYIDGEYYVGSSRRMNAWIYGSKFVQLFGLGCWFQMPNARILPFLGFIAVTGTVGILGAAAQLHPVTQEQ